MRISGFLTNLGKYNEGFLIGEWVSFPVDENELESVFSRIGIDETHEEFFFTDWEYDDIPSLEFGEYENIDDINEIAERFELFSDYELDVFKAAVYVWGLRYVINDDIDSFSLLQDVTSEYDLGYYWLVESGCYDLDKMGNLANYIDYEAFGRDVALTEDGGFSEYGYIYKC